MFGHNEIVGRKFFREHPEAKAGKILVTSVFASIQGEGPFAGWPAVFVRLAKCNLKCDFCFAGNTRVAMFRGPQKKISDVQVGDEVVAYDEALRRFVPGRVTKIYRSSVPKLVCVRTGKSTNLTDRIYCTSGHPFLVKGRGWVRAGDLCPGDMLMKLTPSDRMIFSNPRLMPGVREYLDELARSPERRSAASDKMRETMAKPEVKRRLRLRMRENNPMKDPDVALRGFFARKDRGKKTHAEIKFEKITRGLPIKFVGDGSLVVNKKVPDFVVRGQKKIVEVWAADGPHALARDQEWREKRRAAFAVEGYEVLFVAIPASGVRDGTYSQLRAEVLDFIHNGSVVERVEVVEKQTPAWRRLAGDGESDCVVYNLEVADYHTYVASGKIVHNCDTYFDSGDWMTSAELRAVVQRIQGETRLLVVTGGEPALQKNLISDLSYISVGFQELQIETNGLLPTNDEWIYNCATVVISPKVVGSKYPRSEAALSSADALKFVISADPASPYHEVPKWALDWMDEDHPVFVSPMAEYRHAPEQTRAIYEARTGPDMAARTAAERVSFWEPGLLDLERCRRNYAYAGRYAMEKGLRLTIQMQLFVEMP